MKPLHRILLAAGIFFAAYYGCVFWYAARFKAEQTAHLLWSFTLPNAQDLCADPLSDGTVVASGGGIVYWVKPDGTQRAKYDAYASARARQAKQQNAAQAAGKGKQAPNAQPGGQNPHQVPGQQQGQGIIPPPPVNQYANSYPGSIAWAAGAGDLLFVSTQADPTEPAELTAVDASGKEKWVAVLPTAGGAGWIGWCDKYVYALQGDGMLTQLTLDGKRQWSKQPIKQQGGLTVGSDGWVYLSEGSYYNYSASGQTSNDLVALDASGKERWRRKNSSTWASDRPAVDKNGTLYLMDYSGGLTAIDRKGKTKWTYYPSTTPGTGLRQMFAPSYGSYGQYSGRYEAPVIAGDAVCYIFMDQAIAVTSDGKEKWSRTIQGESMSMAAGPDGSVYVACSSFGVMAIGPNGRIRWRNRSPHNFTTPTMPSVGPDGRVYVEADEKLYCFSP